MWVGVCDVTRGDSDVKVAHEAVTVTTALVTCQGMGNMRITQSFYISYLHNYSPSLSFPVATDRDES